MTSLKNFCNLRWQYNVRQGVRKRGGREREEKKRRGKERMNVFL